MTGDFEGLLKKHFPEPAPIKWVEQNLDGYKFEDATINGEVVASLEKRPHYCDRGHWFVKCFLVGLDNQDKFPRYYMNYETAKLETELFLQWRLWKIRGGP